MAFDLLAFVDTPRQRPPERDVRARRGDFDEIFREFAPEGARHQASRCSQCGIPFCQVHCPLHNHIPDWLKLAAEDRMEEAYELASATNTFPEICGRICPQDRLCEGHCVIEKGFQAVTIGAVERHIVETAFERGWVRPPLPERERAASVGIVGGGPAGLAAADMLRRQGYRVSVYDRYDRIGGLLIYGIPAFKLEKSAVERRTRLLAEAGVRFHVSTEIGRDLSFAELRGCHDAVLIATGVYRARDLALPGAALAGVVPALEYLIASNRHGLGDKVPTLENGTLSAAGRHVAVLGGGDTAMDCVRTAVRQGALSVTCLYRRDRDSMPGSRREVDHAMAEGVEFAFLRAPKALLGNGRVEAVRVCPMRLGEADESGRARPRPASDAASGSGQRFQAGLVIKALGFDPEPLAEAFDLPDLALTGQGTVATDDEDGATSLPGVYAAGDIVRGASLVVWAIRDGRRAAAAIHRDLEARAEAGHG